MEAQRSTIICIDQNQLIYYLARFDAWRYGSVISHELRYFHHHSSILLLSE